MKGVKFELGSVEEAIAIAAFKNEQQLEFLKTKVLVNAILLSGQNIISALSGGGGGSSVDDFNKTFEAYRDFLLPHVSEKRNRDAARSKKLLEKEMNAGPLKIQVMSRNKGKKKRGA